MIKILVLHDGSKGTRIDTYKIMLLKRYKWLSGEGYNLKFADLNTFKPNKKIYSASRKFNKIYINSDDVSPNSPELKQVLNNHPLAQIFWVSCKKQTASTTPNIGGKHTTFLTSQIKQLKGNNE